MNRLSFLRNNRSHRRFLRKHGEIQHLVFVQTPSLLPVVYKLERRNVSPFFIYGGIKFILVTHFDSDWWIEFKCFAIGGFEWLWWRLDNWRTIEMLEWELSGEVLLFILAITVILHFQLKKFYIYLYNYPIIGVFIIVLFYTENLTIIS